MEKPSDEDDEVGRQSDYQWCLKCERAYKRGGYRMIGDLRMCPFPGCHGDAVYDGWDWDTFRRQLPQYPAIPELGMKYLLYPQIESTTRKQEAPPASVGMLTQEARRILEYLVSEMRRGRFRPYDEGTFCGYKETHDALGLRHTRANWGNSLRVQGLQDLATWIKSQDLPAITGLIVGESEPRMPGPGYYRVNDVPEDSISWWRDQVRKSIGFDWSPWVPDIEPVPLVELALDSRSYFEGSSTTITKEVKTRCDVLRRRAKELFRDADGFLRCQVCGWHKPSHGMISGDIVELHHLDPIAEAPEDGRVITIADAKSYLVPVCPTCHRLIHSRTGGRQFEIVELRAILDKSLSKSSG